MSIPAKEELDALANALQLSIKSKISDIKLKDNESVEIRFVSSAHKDPHLKTFINIVDGALQNANKTLRIKNVTSIDWSQLISFLLVTRLAEDNIAAFTKTESEYKFITDKLKLTSPGVNIADVRNAAKFIFDIVESKNMTLRVLSEKSGLTQASLSKFKAGNDIRLSNLIKIAKALGLNIRIE